MYCAGLFPRCNVPICIGATPGVIAPSLLLFLGFEILTRINDHTYRSLWIELRRQFLQGHRPKLHIQVAIYFIQPLIFIWLASTATSPYFCPFKSSQKAS